MVAACDSNKRPKGMSIRQFLAVCEQFIHNLTFHGRDAHLPRLS
jgi:hypothetical protein